MMLSYLMSCRDLAVFTPSEWQMWARFDQGKILLQLKKRQSQKQDLIRSTLWLVL
ncbi:unnamed protein product, partial [Coccothraustes coccothraustes]